MSILRFACFCSFMTLVAPLGAQRYVESFRALPWDTDTIADIRLGDVDGDGDLDAVLADANVDTPNRVYLNDGAGSFRDGAGRMPHLGDQSWAVVLVDVDGDGDLDAAFANRLGRNRLLLNDGSGRFADGGARLPVDAQDCFGVAAADVDGDGDFDLLFASTGPNNLLYENDGAGNFTDASAGMPASPNRTVVLAAGDLDGDGDPDVLVGNGPFAPNELYLNDGTGTFVATVGQLPVANDSTGDIALADVDGDGDLDAFLVNSVLTPNRLFLNDGSANFTDASSQLPPPPFEGGQKATFTDVDGDGDPDIFLARSGIDLLFLNDGAGRFTDGSARVPRFQNGTWTIAAGDLDGDGDTDAIYGLSLRQNRLLLNDGTTTFHDVTDSLPEWGENVAAVELADADGDGDLDVWCGGANQNGVFLNDGRGQLSPSPAPLPVLIGVTQDIAVIDVDGDGDADLIEGNSQTNAGLQNRLLGNDGTGRLSVVAGGLPAHADSTLELVPFDTDADGDLDLFVVNFGRGADRLYLNAGGTFADGSSGLPTGGAFSFGAAAGDLDGNGLDDLYIATQESSLRLGFVPAQNRLYLNHGAGRFTDATGGLPQLLDLSRAAALGDVDGDGDLDVFVGNDGQNRLYLNDGSAHLTDVTATHLPPDLANTGHAAFRDADGDGDLDLWVANVVLGVFATGGAGTAVYRNDGAGVFTEATAALLPVGYDKSVDFAFGDLDADGDEDVVVGEVFRTRVLLNRDRHLGWRSLPRVGRALTLDLAGPPSGAWFLFASPRPGRVSLPPVGVLGLDPATLFPVSGGPLDASGLAAFSVPVPPAAGLAGATIYWQALVGGTPRLTSAVATTLALL